MARPRIRARCRTPFWIRVPGRSCVRQARRWSMETGIRRTARFSQRAAGTSAFGMWRRQTPPQMLSDDDRQIESLNSPGWKTLAAAPLHSNGCRSGTWAREESSNRAGHLGLNFGNRRLSRRRLLATAAEEKNSSRRNAVHLWDAATGKELGQSAQGLGFVDRLAFSPDGTAARREREDGTIRLRLLRTGRIARLASHKHMVEWVGFAADGKEPGLTPGTTTGRSAFGMWLERCSASSRQPKALWWLPDAGRQDDRLRGGRGLNLPHLFCMIPLPAIWLRIWANPRVEFLGISPDRKLLKLLARGKVFACGHPASGKEVAWLRAPSALDLCACVFRRMAGRWRRWRGWRCSPLGDRHSHGRGRLRDMRRHSGLGFFPGWPPILRAAGYHGANLGPDQTACGRPTGLTGVARADE